MVMISGSSRDGQVEITVRDHGIGIPIADYEHVFEGAARAGNGAQVASGHGFGLATVRRLLRDHGGDSWIDGASADGATVRITAPARRVASAPTPTG